MTYDDIYIKFMIEYDKANVTSSYPSLTKYELATILDKAYLALIAQKLTGNNTRDVNFEGDIKAISDLQNLVKYEQLNYGSFGRSQYASNVNFIDLPSTFLYMISAHIVDDQLQNVYGDSENQPLKFSSVQLVPYSIAKNFFVNKNNLPWIKNILGFIQSNKLYIVHDPIDFDMIDDIVGLTYISKPVSFVQSLNSHVNPTFELNDSMAEELISLAIAFALENVESPRLSTKLNTRGLES